MEMKETFESALKRHISEHGYSATKTRDQVRIAGALGISVPFLNELIQGKAEMTEEMAAKMAAFFKTSPQYWSEFPKNKKSSPQEVQAKQKVIDDVPYDHKLPEAVSELATWPHAEYAVELARERYGHHFIEIEPNLFMGAVMVNDGDLIRVLDVCYVEQLPGGQFTLWAGKRIAYRRPHRSSGKWCLQSAEPLERGRGDHLPYELSQKILYNWAVHQWDRNAEDFPYGQRRTISPPPKPLVTVDALSLAATPDLEDLLRSCSRILMTRRMDDTLFEYQLTVDSGNDPKMPKLAVWEIDGNGNLAERTISLKDLGKTVHGKVRQRVEHQWQATYKAKNGAVEIRDWLEGPWVLLINGHRIDLDELTDYEKQPQARIERFVAGIRDEFLPTAKEKLIECERYQYLESQRPEYRDRRLALAAYVEWASKGADTFIVEQRFHYSIDHRYRDDGILPDVFHLTAENNSVTVKNLPFPPQEKRHRSRNSLMESVYSKGRVWVQAKNGDGIKVCEDGKVRYHFPFNGKLFEFPDGAISEARFIRYVDGYRREILLEAEERRQNCLGRLTARSDAAERFKAEIEDLDRFIAWLSQRA